MTIKELRLDLIKKLKDLSDDEFEEIYRVIKPIIESGSIYQLSEGEYKAIDAALKVGENGPYYSRDEVSAEAKIKYPHLRFK